MKLFILGLIILLILVCQIYKTIQEKNPKKEKENILESYSLDKNSDDNIDINEYKDFLKHRRNFHRDNIQYYHELLYKDRKSKEIIKDTNDYNSWLRLNANSVLVETFHGDNKRKKYMDEIEKCRAITHCGMLDKPGYENCGYCGIIGKKKGGGDGKEYNQPGKFDYAEYGGGEVGPDICPADSIEPNLRRGELEFREIGSRWATTEYDCKKLQIQDKCNTVKNCNDLEDESEGGLGNVCGWCPADKAYPKNDDGSLKYDKAYEDTQTNINSDTCDAMHQTYKQLDCKGDDCSTIPYFTKLQRSKECNSCETDEGGSFGPDGKYRHSENCLNDLWTGAMVGNEDDSKIKVQCTTNFDSKGVLYNQNYGDKSINDFGESRDVYNWGSHPYYKIENDMENQIKYPIYDFKMKYNEKMWKTPNNIARRKWKMNNDTIDGKYISFEYDGNHENDTDIDTLWQKCFGKKNNNNKLECIPKDSIINMKDSTRDYSIDSQPAFTKTEGGYYDEWVEKCKKHTGKNTCEMKLDDSGNVSNTGTKKCQVTLND